MISKSLLTFAIVGAIGLSMATSGLLYSAMNQAQDIYTHALAAAYRSGVKLYDPDLATTNDWEIDEKLQRDPDIKAAMEQRWHAVSGRDWRIESASDRPEDKLAAQIVEDALLAMPGFAQARYRLSKACIYARAFEFIETDRRRCRLGPVAPQSWLMPTRLQHIDARRFDFANETHVDPVTHERRDIVIQRLWSNTRMRWERIVCPEVFLQSVYDDEEGRLGYGRGIREALHFFFRFKAVLLEQGLQGAERWAQGLVVGKIDDTRIGSTDRTNADVRDALVATLKKHRSQHVMVIGKTDEIEVHETSGTGHQIVVELIRLLNEAMIKVILGSIRPTGGGEGGSLARTVEEADQSEALIQFDRLILDEAITRDLIGLFWRHNRPTLNGLGLASARMPKFKTHQAKAENPVENATVIKTALEAGVTLRADEVYAKLGFTKPGPRDEVIEKAAPAPSPFGLPPGFGGSEAPPGQSPFARQPGAVPPRAA